MHRELDASFRGRGANSWTVPLEEPHNGLYGWRFQGTDDGGTSYVFDVYKGVDGWHVHRCYD